MSLLEDDDFAEFQAVRPNVPSQVLNPIANTINLNHNQATSFKPNYAALSELDELRKSELNQSSTTQFASQLSQEDEFGDFQSVPVVNSVHRLTSTVNPVAPLAPNQTLHSTVKPASQVPPLINNGLALQVTPPLVNNAHIPQFVNPVQPTFNPAPKPVSSKPKDLTYLLGEFSLNGGRKSSKKEESSKKEVKSQTPAKPTTQLAPQSTHSTGFSDAGKPNAHEQITADRYDVFRELEPEVNEEFAEFQSCSKASSKLDTNSIRSFESNSEVNQDFDQYDDASSFTIAGDEDVIKMWLKMTQTIKQIIHKSFNTLIVNHGQDCAMAAINSERGSQFVEQLEQVYLIAKRIENKFKAEEHELKLIAHEESEQLTKLLVDCEMTWKTLSKLFVTQPSLGLEQNQQIATEFKCLICRSTLIVGNCDLVNHDGVDYHLTCANFWLNAVQLPLPRPG